MTYACTYIEKRATVDNYETGCEIDGRIVMSERCDICGDSLAELIEHIRNTWYIALDDLWIPSEENEPVTRIGFNRLETVDGDEPSERQLADWKRGEFTLYLCDYDFQIERREVSGVPLVEFAAAGITTHA